MTSSATGGYLAPSLGDIASREQVEDSLHAAIVGMTGLTPEMVRPRWQQEPPKPPANNVNWCAFGVSEWQAEDYPEVRHQGAGDGQDILTRNEVIAVLVSFYGPLASILAKQLSLGLYVEQNREQLRKVGIVFVEAKTLRHLPAVAGVDFRERFDLPLVFRVQSKTNYAVLNILKSTGTIEADKFDGQNNQLLLGMGCTGD